MSSDIGDDMGTGMHYSFWLFRYDERGRWIETRSGAEKADPADASTCTWEGDHIARCKLWRDTATADRDASGRLARVTHVREEGTQVVDVTYGARGELTAVGKNTMRYDDRGRISGFVLDEQARSRSGDTVIERDASGKVVREVGRLEVRTFTYESDGRRVREAVSKRKPWPLSSELPPEPPKPDAITTAGARWNDDDLCMDCEDGVSDSPKDPETERKEMLEWIERSGDIHSVAYEGANVMVVGRGQRGPQRRSRHYSYDCTPAK